MERHKKAGKNFPAKLHSILLQPAYSNIITWMVSHISGDVYIKFHMGIFVDG